MTIVNNEDAAKAIAHSTEYLKRARLKGILIEGVHYYRGTGKTSPVTYNLEMIQAWHTDPMEIHLQKIQEILQTRQVTSAKTRCNQRNSRKVPPHHAP
jgi:hypothetical protein